MSAGWTAGAVRARAIARRRAGEATARRCATSDDTSEALRMLAGTTYGRRLHPGLSLEAAEHAIEMTLLWNLRVLAGWQPRAGARLLRIVVCGYEAADIVARMRELGGGEAGTPYELGALATAWPSVRRAATAAEVRRALAASPWGDPGAEDPATIAFFLQLSGALRLAALGPEAARWAAGDAAVAVAREVYLAGRRIDDAAARVAAKLLGSAPAKPQSWESYLQHLPHDARWALEGVSSPDELWRAEAACRLRKEADSRELLRRGGLGPGPVLAAAMLLCVDAWRVCAALEAAARSERAAEVFDAVA
ncbi:hypothetical protein [Catenulispora subtropica]|uniref:H+transporting two-sector ATPase C (AC39) subunit n=1 Tax=Catenulispora subtropica TaxID=450798 RepID=A0ABP5ESS8_9ACTN